MPGYKRVAWVTHALDEESGVAALIQGKSLRVASTRAYLAVVVDQNIPDSLKQSLQLVFDLVLTLKEGCCWSNLRKIYSNEILTVLYSLGMTYFDKCIVLNPSSICFENPDYLFNLSGDEFREKLSVNSFHDKIPVLVEPCKEILKQLDILNETDKTGKSFLGRMKPNFIKSAFSYFSATEDDKILGVLIKQNKIKFITEIPSIKLNFECNETKTENKPGIVHLQDLQLFQYCKNKTFLELGRAGELEKKLYNFWMDLYNERSTDSLLGSSRNFLQYESAIVEPIAVIGMACRLPSANNALEFWDLLRNGRNAIIHPPEHRWTKGQHPIIPTGVENTQAGFLLDPIDKFDARFFNISPKEATAMDPQHRLLLEVVWECLENASLNPQSLQGLRGGVFLGSWLNTYREILELDTSVTEFFRSYAGNCVGAGAHRVSHLLGWTGPCIGIESDCAAGLTCVSLACKSLRSGDSNIALACGVNLLVKPFSLSTMNAFLSPDFRCKTFDEAADGFARAEGIGVLVLKRYSDAVRDSDNVLGLIRGSAISQEGMSSSMGTPTAAAQVEAMELALKDAGIQPSQISYLEAHGTGTAVGDPVEMAAISKVYGRNEGCLVIGSAKANVGHTESCSGITGLIKVILQMQNELIPSHINFKNLNPKINLDGMGAKLPLDSIPWPKIPGKPRIAGISSFGLAGKNSHVIFEEPPNPEAAEPVNSLPERSHHILKMSAKSQSALEALIKKYENFFQENQAQWNFADIVYTANVARADFNHRAVLISDNFKNAYEILKSGNIQMHKVTSGLSKPICFLFTGQGSQYHGMAKKLYESSRIFRLHFDYCSEWLESRYNISLKKVYFIEPSEEIHKTIFSQTGIFVVEFCLMKLWRSWGIAPSFVLGHSLGEYCAAVCAGILNIEDALTLVAERSRLIDNLPEGKMLVVKANFKTVYALQKQFFRGGNPPKALLDYAAFNTEDQTVVAGNPEIVLHFKEFLSGEGIKSTVLKSTHAFHSKDMDEILEEFGKVAEGIKFKNSEITFISGMSGKVESKIDAKYWVQHARDPVNFLEASKTLLNNLDCEIFIEVGPNPVLSSLILLNSSGDNHQIDKLCCLPSIRKGSYDWKTIFTSLGKLYAEKGIEIKWEEVDRGFNREKVGHLLPSYPFQGTRFWPKIPSNSQTLSEHPLLGCLLPNPTQTIIFQSELSVSNLNYLKDHKLGDRIIFPGAGYIEMILAAGAASAFGTLQKEFTKPSRPIQVKDLRIKAPLELLDDPLEGTNCQITLNSNEEGFMSSVFHLGKETASTNHWVEHASGTFYPHNNYSKSEGNKEDLECLRNLHLTHQDSKSNLELISSIKLKSKEECLLKPFYERYAPTGLNLGPAFQTLLKVWRVEGSLLAEVEVPTNSGKYLLHPLLIDCMIQLAAFPHGDAGISRKPKLLVPVGCNRFVWMRPLESSKCFVYSESQTSLLFNEFGDLVAILFKLEVAETNVENIKAILEAKRKSLPNFYGFQWEKLDCFKGFDFSKGKDGVALARESPQMFADLTEEEMGRISDISRLCSLYVTKAILKLGWALEVGTRISETELIKNLGIAERHVGLFKHFLTFLEEDGLLERTLDRKWAVKGRIPSVEEVQEEIANLMSKNCSDLVLTSNGSPLPVEVPLNNIPFVLLYKVGEKMEEFLQGKESALPVLYPNDSSTISAGSYYEIMYSRLSQVLPSILQKHWKELKTIYKGESLPTLRILEIGAGTGLVTGQFLESLAEAEIPFEYVYTDISSVFFSEAEKRFKRFEGIKFRKLNIEQDPLSQGFPPQYFDVAVAFHVIHATKDIRQSLSHVRRVLKNGGNLWLSETIGNDRMTDCLFGLLEGFWRFTDFDLRPSHCMLPVEKWEKVTKEMGFSDFHYISDAYKYGLIGCRADNLGFEGPLKILPEVKSWLIFYGGDGLEEKVVEELVKYFKQIGRENLIMVKVSSEGDNLLRSAYHCVPSKFDSFCQSKLVEILSKSLEGIIVTWGLSQSEHSQENLAMPYLRFLQSLIKLPPGQAPPCILLTKGQYPVGDLSCVNPSPSTLIGMSITALNEDKNLKLKIIDLDPGVELGLSIWQSIQEIFTRFRKETPLISVFRGENKLRPKFTSEKYSIQGLSLPVASDRFQIDLPNSKLISDVKFQPLEPYYLNNDEIEVKILFTALNFRDVLSILRPDEFFVENNRVGVDFSGVITQIGASVRKFKVGDEVFGLNLSQQHLPSHVKLREENVQKVPTSFTLSEASCLPLAFATAYQSIIELAKGRKGERILIHSASGGVGLIAIQIAKNLGLEVICTAGNERKRAYLKALGIENIFNSRSLKFSREILKATEGKGVDIVLNSLTGPGFKEATLEVCAEGARFIELSKLNIWTEEEVRKLRADVNYIILEPLEFEKILGKGELTKIASEWMNKGLIKPMPYTRFDAEDVKDALTYLQDAKQVGRVLCQMPQSFQISQRINEGPTGKQNVPLFNEKSTYLITGGLGGIGLEVCKYMVRQGARHFVLLGRNPPTTTVSEFLETFKKANKVKIVVLQGDVGSLEDCRRVFDFIASPESSLPPLRGIMHAAGTLSDGMLESLEWSDFQKTFQSKVEGSWNLHELAKKLPLEHFVLFSSVAGKFALSGQASHVAACVFEDTLAHFRNSQGLPGTSINWGQWTEVGVARNMDIKYVLPFNLKQGINALDLILRKNISSTTVVNLRENLGSIIDHYPYMKWVTDRKVLSTPSEYSKTSKEKLNSVNFWRDFESTDKRGSPEGKLKVAKHYVEIMLRTVLRLEQNEVISEDVDLSVMGMDSLMMIELFNLMQSTCGKKIPITKTALRDCKTFKDLSVCFLEIVEEKWKEVEAPTVEEVRKQCVEDVVLPEDIKLDAPGSHVAPSEIKCLLVTGTTGFVGSHMLKELLECPQLEKIYCLVRGVEPMKSLLSVFKRNRITIPEDLFLDKVMVISGDFTKDKLGLNDEVYQKLCGEVEGVHHIGAMMHHYEYYRKVDGSSKDIRSVNVGGLLEILRFCCKSRTKHLFHTSSLIVAWERGEDGALLESWPSLERLTSFDTNMGYPLSKMINELHLKTAVERGIPCKALRYCQLRASTTSGKSFAEGSHLMKLALFSLKEGLVPAEPFPVNVIPVDVAAKLTTELVFNDEAHSGVYHISHPRPLIVKDVHREAAESLGLKMKVVDSQEFADHVVRKCLEAVNEFDKDGETSALRKASVYELQTVYQDKHLHGFLLQFANATGEGREKCEDFWVSKKLLKFVPEIYSGLESPAETLRRDLEAAISEGLFDLF